MPADDDPRPAPLCMFCSEPLDQLPDGRVRGCVPCLAEYAVGEDIDPISPAPEVEADEVADEHCCADAYDEVYAAALAATGDTDRPEKTVTAGTEGMKVEDLQWPDDRVPCGWCTTAQTNMRLAGGPESDWEAARCVDHARRASGDRPAKEADPNCPRCHGVGHTTIPPCRGCGATAGDRPAEPERPCVITSPHPSHRHLPTTWWCPGLAGAAGVQPEPPEPEPDDDTTPRTEAEAGLARALRRYRSGTWPVSAVVDAADDLLAAASGVPEPERPPTAAQAIAHIKAGGTVEEWFVATQRWLPHSPYWLAQTIEREGDPSTPQPGLRLVSGEPAEPGSET